MDRIRVKYEYTQFGKELDRPLGELSLCSTFTAQPQLLPGRQSVHTTPTFLLGLAFLQTAGHPHGIHARKYPTSSH